MKNSSVLWRWILSFLHFYYTHASRLVNGMFETYESRVSIFLMTSRVTPSQGNRPVGWLILEERFVASCDGL